MAQLEPVAIDEVPHALRQLLVRRHLRPLQEHGRDRNIPLEGGFDLEPHVVSGILETAFSRGILRLDPTPADQSQQQIARCQAVLEDLAEVAPQGDGVNVHEYGRLAEPRYESLEQGPRLTRGFFPSVTDENRCHGSLPYGRRSYECKRGQTPFTYVISYRPTVLEEQICQVCDSIVEEGARNAKPGRATAASSIVLNTLLLRPRRRAAPYSHAVIACLTLTPSPSPEGRAEKYSA